MLHLIQELACAIMLELKLHEVHEEADFRLTASNCRSVHRMAHQPLPDMGRQRLPVNALLCTVVTTLDYDQCSNAAATDISVLQGLCEVCAHVQGLKIADQVTEAHICRFHYRQASAVHTASITHVAFVLDVCITLWAVELLQSRIAQGTKCVVFCKPASPY